MKSIGKTFSNELKAAGLFGLPFSWGADGDIQFGAGLSQAQIDAVNAVYAAHDPLKTVLTYLGIEVSTKADVDAITRQRIIDLGEEKAKTEKIIAGSGECPIWDTFVIARAAIIQEGDAFIAANNLT